MIYSNFSQAAFYIYSNILPWGQPKELKKKKACQEWMIEKHPFSGEVWYYSHCEVFYHCHQDIFRENFQIYFGYIFLNGDKNDICGFEISTTFILLVGILMRERPSQLFIICC